MINCRNASDRLKTTPEMLEKRLMGMGVDLKMKMTALTLEEEKELIDYLDKYIVKFTVNDLERLLDQHEKMSEVLLRLTCLSGDLNNLEAIGVILKIIKNKHQLNS